MNRAVRCIVVTVIVLLLHLLLGVRLFWRPAPAAEPVMAPGQPGAEKAASDAEEAPGGAPEAVPSSPAATAETGRAAGTAADGTPAVTAEGRPGPQVPARSAFPVYSRGFYRYAPLPMPDKLQRMVASCRAGVVIDVEQRTVLWQKNATQNYPIASLTKLLTAQLLIEKVAADPAVNMQSVLKVTAADSKYLRSRRITGVYLDSRDHLTFSEYVKCMIIASANDCAVIAGKYIGGGDIEAGVVELNRRARELGLTGMHLYNANGLPIDRGGERIENTGSALEVAYLAERSLGFPEIMKWAKVAGDSIREDTKRFDLHSTNKLLRARVPGVNGLKTGYTATAGYCMAVTCRRGNRTVIVVVMGVPGNDYGRHRDAIAKALLDWVYG